MMGRGGEGRAVKGRGVEARRGRGYCINNLFNLCVSLCKCSYFSTIIKTRFKKIQATAIQNKSFLKSTQEFTT
jgi:hypothetical protein